MTEKARIRLWGPEKLAPKETASAKPLKGHKSKPRKVLIEGRSLYTLQLVCTEMAKEAEVVTRSEVNRVA